MTRGCGCRRLSGALFCQPQVCQRGDESLGSHLGVAIEELRALAQTPTSLGPCFLPVPLSQCWEPRLRLIKSRACFTHLQVTAQRLFQAISEHVISPPNGVSAGSQPISVYHPTFTYTLPTERVRFPFLILNRGSDSAAWLMH